MTTLKALFSNVLLSLHSTVPFSSLIQSVSSMWPLAGGEHRKLKELRLPKWVLLLLPNLNPTSPCTTEFNCDRSHRCCNRALPPYPSLKFIMDCVLIFSTPYLAPVPFPEFEQEYSYSNSGYEQPVELWWLFFVVRKDREGERAVGVRWSVHKPCHGTKTCRGIIINQSYLVNLVSKILMQVWKVKTCKLLYKPL